MKNKVICCMYFTTEGIPFALFPFFLGFFFTLVLVTSGVCNWYKGILVSKSLEGLDLEC